MRKSIHSLLFISAFSPSLLILSLLNESDSHYKLESLMLLVLFVLFSLLAWLIVVGIQRLGESLPIKVKNIETKKSLLVPFLATLIFPGIMRTLETDFNVIKLILVCLFCSGFVLSYMPIHPILRLVGYRFYKLETEKGCRAALITKRPNANSEDIRSVIRITDNLLFESV